MTGVVDRDAARHPGPATLIRMSDWQGRQIGPYLVKERLGRGGMGVVYRAVDTTLERQVAIKMMVPAGDDHVVTEQTARFTLEAKAAARIKSRHVAQVIQYGQTESGELYIVMELLEGKALDKVLLHGRIPAARAVRIARHIAKGMRAAHELGIVHRDLKPANVMLCSVDGEDDVAKVLDFGVAKMTNDGAGGGLTQQGALLGTLPFMEPEQINGAEIDGRTDVYSLGVILFRMLAGAPLFDVESLSDLVRYQTSTPAPRIAERAVGPVDIPQALEDAVLKCLEKKPERRFQSMRELDVALAAAMGDDTSVSGPRRRPLEETLPTGFRVGMLTSADAPTMASQSREDAHAATLAAGAPHDALTVGARPIDLGPAPSRSRLVPVAAGLLVLVGLGVGVGLLMAGGGDEQAAAAVVVPAPPTVAPVDAPPAAPAAAEPPALAGAPSAPPEVAAGVVTAATPPSAEPIATPTSKPKAKAKPRPKPQPKPTPAAPEAPSEPSGFVRVHTKEGG